MRPNSWLLFHLVVADSLSASKYLEQEIEDHQSVAFLREMPGGGEGLATALSDQNAVSRRLSEFLEEIDRASSGAWT